MEVLGRSSAGTPREGGLRGRGDAMVLGNHDGFVEWASDAQSWLRRQAYLLSGNWHDADDLVQDVLLKIYRRWHALSRRDTLRRHAAAHPYQDPLLTALWARRR
jgi:DNA-directed RNA polymerase specialized sigma24 family protein